MAITQKSLRLHLAFFDEFKRVQVLGAKHTSLYTMGFVNSSERLRDLLESASIDRFLVLVGDPVGGNFEVTAYELTPGRIVETLEKNFRRRTEIEDKILLGSELTEQEKTFEPPTTLWVCSGSVNATEGLKRVADWFSAQASAPIGI